MTQDPERPRTIACVGTGPSLAPEQIDSLNQLRRGGDVHAVIAVNRAFEYVHPTHTYIADRHAYRVWRLLLPSAAPVYTPFDHDETVRVYTDSGLIGLNIEPKRVNLGGSGGYQAVNLAYHLGADRILLLGYDYQHTDGRTHVHGDHPEGWANFGSPEERGQPFHNLARDLSDRGVLVLNCTPRTSLTCFPRVDIEHLAGTMETT